ncbi:gastrula zinc finger protein XlCGF44.2-like [Sipha flava]|jgi:KRAB domain-containing zinc finger protein|uniref:Gastrula zinc finger protein XlCGF44.2-like n=1 Tax=Sipha flava TaxID=143950 RepID=A0A8B8FF01_9HEMI|nr:gastrula zinc finger protein XlCGF44.2-like [Sipha flava]
MEPNRVPSARQDREPEQRGGGSEDEPVPKPFRCWVCLNRFVSNPKLVDHMRVNHTNKSKICPWCPAAFMQEKRLDQHVRVVHGRPWFEYSACPTCGVIFKPGITREDHKKAHAGAAPYVCVVCHRAFAHHKNLSEHMCSHRGQKRCMCAICGKTYMMPAYLDKHIRTKHGLPANRV